MKFPASGTVPNVSVIAFENLLIVKTLPWLITKKNVVFDPKNIFPRINPKPHQ